MAMPRVTPHQVRAWGACYGDARIAELFAGREFLTLAEVMELDIPMEDRLWVVARCLPIEVLYEIACRIVELVLPLFEAAYPKDRIIHDVLRWRRATLQADAAPSQLPPESAALAALEATRLQISPSKAAYGVVLAAKVAARSRVELTTYSLLVYVNACTATHRHAMETGANDAAEHAAMSKFDADCCRVVLECASSKEP